MYWDVLKRPQLRERIYRAFISGFQNKYGAYSELEVDLIFLANSVPQFVVLCVHNLDINVLLVPENEFILFCVQDFRTISDPLMIIWIEHGFCNRIKRIRIYCAFSQNFRTNKELLLLEVCVPQCWSFLLSTFMFWR